MTMEGPPVPQCELPEDYGLQGKPRLRLDGGFLRSSMQREVHRNVPRIGGRLLGAHERVARQVLQARVNDHCVAALFPRRLRLEPPGPLARAGGAVTGQWRTGLVVHPESVLQECMVQRPVKLHGQRVDGAYGGLMEPPPGGVYPGP